MKVKFIYLKIIKHELTETQHAEAAQELAENRKHSDYSDQNRAHRIDNFSQQNKDF